MRRRFGFSSRAQLSDECIDLFDLEGLDDGAHVSALKRAQQTLGHVAEALGQTFPIAVNAALNERDYGEYTRGRWKDE